MFMFMKSFLFGLTDTKYTSVSRELDGLNFNHPMTMMMKDNGHLNPGYISVVPGYKEILAYLSR